MKNAKILVIIPAMFLAGCFRAQVSNTDQPMGPSMGVADEIEARPRISAIGYQIIHDLLWSPLLPNYKLKRATALAEWRQLLSA